MTRSELLSNLKIITHDGDISYIPHSSCVLALGTFDGVHTAHRALLEKAVALKKDVGADSVGVWCFEHSPSAHINKAHPEMLSSNKEKIRILLDIGADFVAVARFEDFRDMSAEDFAENVLIDALCCVGTVCGFNHRFGKGGAGNPQLLERIFGNAAVTVGQVALDGETVSSSAIRAHIKCGEMETANLMLGRPLSFSSAVTSGKRLGRTMGFPTANQSFPDGFIRMKRGVYATRCILEGGESYIGVSNVGIRPSIATGDDHKPNSETYIIGFSGSLYGMNMTVEFHKFLREERSFASLDELKLAIEKDACAAKEFFTKK